MGADLFPLAADLSAARSQMAFTLGFHIVLACIGVGFPAIFFILAAAGAIESDLAFNLAKWTGVGLIAFYGYWAARLSGSTARGAWVQALAVALIGAALITLKAVLH